MTETAAVLATLVQALLDGSSWAQLPGLACARAVTLLGCAGGAITIDYSTPNRATIHATDAATRACDDLQETVGQGPGHDAFQTATYARLDLDAPGDISDERWPLLAGPPLTDLAPVTLHAVPLVRDGRAFGVLTLVQRGRPVAIPLDAASDLAVLIGSVVLATIADPDDGLPESWNDRAEVHQATGMVVAQLRVTDADALALIRAHAYSRATTIRETAHAIVRRQLTFHTGSGEIRSS